MSSRSILEIHGILQQKQEEQQREGSSALSAVRLPSIAAIAKAMLVTRRRLRLTPDKKLFFLYEPGKQVSSAVRIKNTSGSPVAFKFQTNSPKSCFMRPPSCILQPGEAIVATVVKFIEVPESNQEKKSKEKFKIVSLKVKQGTDFTPELFDERKEFVAVERVLRVAFLDPKGDSPEIDKLKKRLAEAEAAEQARKKTSEDKSQKAVATTAAGGVVDEWKEQQKEKRTR
ncbi:hypothetical protein L7F22_004347 [Adiantum nelumboides]|nr:hypothetical protein [Adiantum nelumboides]